MDTGDVILRQFDEKREAYDMIQLSPEMWFALEKSMDLDEGVYQLEVKDK